MIVVDSHLARGGSRGGVTFHNRGGPHGRTNGAKRVVAVDVTGLVMAGVVVSASTSENVCLERILTEMCNAKQTGRLELVLVDRGVSARAAVSLSRRFGVEVRRVWCDTPKLDSEGRRVFQPIAHAWRVEVAHATLGWSRRLAKSFENTTASASGWLQIAAVRAVLAGPR
jgi:transposase